MCVTAISSIKTNTNVAVARVSLRGEGLKLSVSKNKVTKLTFFKGGDKLGLGFYSRLTHFAPLYTDPGARPNNSIF